MNPHSVNYSAGMGYDKPVELERKNFTPGKKPYPHYFNKFSAWLVNRTAGDALAEFGYAFDKEPVGTGLLIRTPKGKDRLDGRAASTAVSDVGQ